MREIFLTEGFFEHLRKHAVPLNEHAIRQLRESATALDLYTWLAYRLPRISPKRPRMSWQQLAVHFGNEGHNIRKFRQTVRDAWERQVSAVYPEARAEFDTTIIRLHASPAPLQRTLVPARRSLTGTSTDAADAGTAPDRRCRSAEVHGGAALSHLGRWRRRRGSRRDCSKAMADLDAWPPHRLQGRLDPLQFGPALDRHAAAGCLGNA